MSHYGPRGGKGGPCLWDAETGKPIGEPLRGHEDWVSSAAFSPLIISRSNVPELSKNIIQKGLAFARDWSGTVAHSGSKDAPRSCPAGSVADAGLRWCGATPLPTERRISNVKGCEEIIICFDS